MLRLQAITALSLGRVDAAAARAGLEAAIALAHEQSAMALEFRAVCSLARLLQGIGERTRARDLVRPAYDAFSEGHDTRDLREGRELLDELSA